MPRTLQIDPSPDFRRLEMVLRREGEPDRVPLYELFTNLTDPVLKRLGKWQDTTAVNLTHPERYERFVQNAETYFLSLGYDYMGVGGKGFNSPKSEPIMGTDARGQRHYLKSDFHMIAFRKDFEQYPWPDMQKIDYAPLECAKQRMPAGMKGIAGCSGILENTMWLFGYEGISLMLYDDEELVKDVFDAVGSRIVAYLGTCASSDAVGAIQMGDDMGYKSQTMLPPDVYRKFLFPWHRRLVEAVHAHGKPIILHSCGNLAEIMEDIIDCGWEAKHSFEDSDRAGLGGQGTLGQSHCPARRI